MSLGRVLMALLVKDTIFSREHFDTPAGTAGRLEHKSKTRTCRLGNLVKKLSGREVWLGSSRQKKLTVSW